MHNGWLLGRFGRFGNLRAGSWPDLSIWKALLVKCEWIGTIYNLSVYRLPAMFAIRKRRMVLHAQADDALSGVAHLVKVGNKFLETICRANNPSRHTCSQRPQGTAKSLTNDTGMELKLGR